jgi:hypothetical protein
VEQRVAVDQHVVMPKALHRRVGPGGKYLCAVAVARQLGRAGGAAGVEVRGDVGGGEAPLAQQAVSSLGGAQGVEVPHAVGPGRGHQQGLAVCRHQQQGGQFGHQRLQVQGLGPQARPVVVAMGDQHPRAAGAQQRQQLVVAEHRVQRLHDAGGLAAPQRQVVGQPARQHHRHHILKAHAQLAQQVGGLVQAVEQVPVAPAGHRAVGVPGVQEGEGGTLRKGIGRVGNQLVGAGPGHGLRQRSLFEALDVGFAADGGQGGDGHGRESWWGGSAGAL